MLADTQWLSNHLNDPNLRIVDCRYVLSKPSDGKKAYLESHIPGAIHLDIDQDLAAREGPGRHPIPRTTDFSITMSNAGIDQTITVVAYDDVGGAYAARLWWLLRYFGHEKVALLNGGWTKWATEGRPVTKEVPKIKARSFKASPHPDWVVNKEQVKKMIPCENCLLIDARSPERYRGEVEPIDKKAGHIPGAKNAPFANNVDPTTKEFKNVEELKKQFETLGVKQAKEIISYCGSGVTACHNIFVLKLLGLDAKLYEGSWSDWSNDPNLPAEK
ncbi:MAG: hypothetical protein A3F82_07020 [Deltaproteobacteria bacterium RIFCSPLOWO2_12_FULL_44_12]|nr:MAG: hypothetical protein A2712_09855 [Deltaproteobacteria bacterium RIFCSPHIGHO2_01_FULL_43_49]OGQ15416.1 MAG: hypothetical protein A3D22_10385 [Deltaproteobacteria bacterium RIFCSPHIGHO2_02_FULL_44_53]OGQ29609.1 MAG: hypothetical protein A3D98_10585 [Deltaproteobacteria bacterium RIFCSPHIGHO2_12_FULL_44_21]OGQ32222.1 MAG: hypothetical protein A2979_00230 [Deltaproteobacteria bacterium RIFCSPLOWO2_01_FULL_45_74]OGQ43864.1 MAG: hypothetical protein A3I70_04125 [Deltaproteobacteria bacterium 